MRKILLILFFFNLLFSKVHSIEPDVFVQSTVNRASMILSKDISKEEKISGLKSLAKETVDIRGVGFYSLGSARKSLDEDQLKELLDELTETFYKVKKKQGGVIKDPTFTKYFSDGGSADDEKPKPIDPLKLMLQINAMSDAEREQLEYMLEKLGVKKK